MAQLGTDIIEQIVPGQPPLVVPCNYVVVAVAPSLGTAGSTTSTLTLNKNGSTTGVAPTLGNTQTTNGVTACSVPGVAGDVLSVSAALGTSAASPALTLQIQRA